MNSPENASNNIYKIAATEKAQEMGISKVFNMVVLGGFLKLKPIVGSEFIHKGLEKSLPERHHNLIPQNEDAIEVGKGLIEAVQVL